MEENKEIINKSAGALSEELVLKFWKENNIFEKTLKKESPKGEFVFYEGPPTANAKPALHHFEARAFKDVIPRYKTMSGFHVERKGGWDTHGLPVELQIEKKLGLKSKKEIEQYGVEKFNKECKDSVFQYIGDWEVFTDRMGYWIDKENAYYTFDNSYIESVWNVLKTVDSKKLLYKDYKVLPWCPRCGTALSSHELAQGYQDDKDLSVTAKFKIKGVQNGYFLAWTTTPWTLPGNVALAVGPDIVYVEAKVETENGSEVLVLAKERLSVLTVPYEILAEHKGSEMVGMEYEPLYPFMNEKFAGKNPEAFTKTYKVYPADFVTTTDGTGIVHTAVMYGQEDFVLGTQIGLPKFHLVKEDGHFLPEMQLRSGDSQIDLSDRFVKDEEVAIDIIKDLAHRGILFKKEKYEHSYPHCWRCKTPLIYYARDSWYIGMSQLRDKLVAENEDINWEPAYIKEGRFGEWLREIKDWAISRERYWGTPLPIWADKDGNYRLIGSIEDLKKNIKKSGNQYFVMRHGQTEGNLKQVWSLDSNGKDPLTEAGEQMVKDSAGNIKQKNIDIIIASPFERTQETASIVAKTLGIAEENIVTDARLGEWNVGGEFNGKYVEDFFKARNASTDRYKFKADDGESYMDVLKRSGEFMHEIEKKYSGKNILIISHGAVSRAICLVSEGFSFRNLLSHTATFNNFNNAEIRQANFVALPHNQDYELDLHRPFIDEAELVDENGEKITRVKEVLDVWFDSGAMPFAQSHYPFNKEIRYPADFISEAIDQTRGWFYTLHAIGVLMDKGKAFKNVICLGHILDANGKKMSKSIGNIVDPWMMINKFGVDALRLWMYGVNQPGESKNFDEKTVDEIIKKVFNPLDNILSFYNLYKGEGVVASRDSQNILDKWIIAKLDDVIKQGTWHLDRFKPFEASRSIREFVNEFSTWYVRRSRDRFKSEDVKERNESLATTKFVLLELSKFMAPFTPFFSESLYQKLKEEKDMESVHLASWPEIGEVDLGLLTQMDKVRSVVSLALERRQKAGIKVRQPLASLIVEGEFSQELLGIIADEVNVKEVKSGPELILDTNLTDDLKKEGIARDIIRAIQDARKTEGLTPSQSISISVSCSPETKTIIETFEKDIKSPTGVNKIDYIDEPGKYEVELPNEKLTFSIII